MTKRDCQRGACRWIFVNQLTPPPDLPTHPRFPTLPPAGASTGLLASARLKDAAVPSGCFPRLAREEGRSLVTLRASVPVWSEPKRSLMSSRTHTHTHAFAVPAAAGPVDS